MMNNVTWCILLVVMIVWNLDAIIVNVKTAFLHGDLEEETYMNLLDGMEGLDDECLLLLKVLYRLVQGAHHLEEEVHSNPQEHRAFGRLHQSMPHDQAFKQQNSVCFCVH